MAAGIVALKDKVIELQQEGSTCCERKVAVGAGDHHGRGSSLDVTTKSVRLLRQFEQRNRRRASGTSPRPASTRPCRSASRRWRQDLHHTSTRT
jgi:hypothetical protein